MRRISILCALFLMLFFYGCAQPVHNRTVRLIWPSPPETPRIVYLKSYYGQSSFRKSESMLDILIGKKRTFLQMRKPYGAAASDGKIYVADTGHAVVFIFNTKKKKLSFLGNRGYGRLAVPVDVAVDTKNHIVYVSDAKLKKIFGYDSKGNLRIAIGKKGEFKSPTGIAVNSRLGRLYVVDTFAHRVDVFSVNGKKLFDFGKRGVGNGEFNYPSNIAIDRRNGNVWVTDTQNFRVEEFDKNGKFIRKFGKIGDIPGTFTRPKGIAVDSDGNVYVADAAFDNFQIFNEKGKLLLYIGSFGSAPGHFILPAGMYADKNDKIYVVDSINGRVEVFQYVSKRWKKQHPEKYKKLLLPPLKEKEK